MNLEPLCVTPIPNVDESWNGYVLRLSGANFAQKPSEILRYAGLDLNGSRRVAPIEIIAALSNKSVEKLSKIHYQNDSGKTQLGGNLISKFYLQLRQPKVCAECIKNNGYIPAKWDLLHLTACDIHKVWLDESCDSCQCTLSWQRPRINKCKCKSVLKQHNREEVPEIVLDITKVISAVFEGKQLVNKESLTGMPFEYLSTLTLNELIELIDILGKENLTDSVVTRFGRGKQRIDMKSVCINAAYTLSNWPCNFDAFMDSSWSQAINSYNYGRQSSLYFNFAQSSLSEEKKSFLLNQILRHSDFDETDLSSKPIDEQIAKLHFQKLWLKATRPEKYGKRDMVLEWTH
jgi:hypothetical protein